MKCSLGISNFLEEISSLSHSIYTSGSYNSKPEKQTTQSKIRGTKGTLHAKMGTIKDRNGMDLTEAEDIKKRRQENTEEIYKKKKSQRPR